MINGKYCDQHLPLSNNELDNVGGCLLKPKYNWKIEKHNGEMRFGETGQRGVNVLMNNLIVAAGDHTRLNSVRDCCALSSLILFNLT